ncbi:MAG: GPP34 family phosphoprotein [Puniceicoccaceae bacterium]
MVPLTSAEQLLLLALDDEMGKLLPMPDRALDYALAGAVLADLVRVGRVEISMDSIAIVDPNPVQSAPEDLGLLDLEQADVNSLKGALSHLAGDAHGLRKRVIEQLVSKGVLQEVDKEFLWVFHFSRYPLADPETETAVKQRLRNRIRDSQIPMTNQDHVLISLIHACQLESLLLSDEEYSNCSARIEEIATRDRIGHAVTDCLEEIQKAILEIRTYSGM